MNFYDNVAFKYGYNGSFIYLLEIEFWNQSCQTQTLVGKMFSFYWMHMKSFDSQSQSTGFLDVYVVGILCVDAFLFNVIRITNSILSPTTNIDLQFLARCISSLDEVNYIHCLVGRAVSKPRVKSQRIKFCFDAY